MADSIKIGNLDITLKLGSSDVTAAYIGDTLVYSGGTQPTFLGKWLATYTGGTTSSAECDASSAITKNEINLTNLVKVEIGDCVTSIGEFVFMECRSLTSCTIGSGVTSIGAAAFQNCAFTSIIIPNGVTNIGMYAFRYCSSLTSIDIPDSVTSIGRDAFYNCTSLTSITVNATVPPTLGSSVFDGSTCPIYVPSGSVSAYQSASEWSSYASRIQAIPGPQTLQWVTFNNGDTIPSDLDIYGISGTGYNLYNTFGNIYPNPIYIDLSRNKISVTISDCYSEYDIPMNDTIELIFSNIGCSDYYNQASQVSVGQIQLYIYA